MKVFKFFARIYFRDSTVLKNFSNQPISKILWGLIFSFLTLFIHVNTINMVMIIKMVISNLLCKRFVSWLPEKMLFFLLFSRMAHCGKISLRLFFANRQFIEILRGLIFANLAFSKISRGICPIFAKIVKINPREN